MGIKSWWSDRQQKRLHKKVTKYSKKIYNINTTHEKRDLILYELSGLEGEEVVLALLNRFELTLHENPIKDESEKEKVTRNIIARGDISIPPVKEFIKKSNNISWPLDILKELMSEEDFLAFVLETLTTEEVLFDEQVIEKRLLVLEAIAGYKHDGIYPKVQKLIHDDDDRVKISALNILADQDNIDEVRQGLLEALVDEETSPRIVKNLVDIFVKKEWKLTGHKNRVLDIISGESFYVNKSGIIKSR